MVIFFFSRKENLYLEYTSMHELTGFLLSFVQCVILQFLSSKSLATFFKHCNRKQKLKRKTGTFINAYTSIIGWYRANIFSSYACIFVCVCGGGRVILVSHKRI